MQSFACDVCGRAQAQPEITVIGSRVHELFKVKRAKAHQVSFELCGGCASVMAGAWKRAHQELKEQGR